MVDHAHIISVELDARGIVRLYLEKYKNDFREVLDVLKHNKDRAGVKQWEALVSTLSAAQTEPEVDCVPLHAGAQLLGRLARQENEVMVKNRERAIKKNAVAHYSETKFKPKYEFEAKDWKKIAAYRLNKRDEYEFSRDIGELSIMMQRDLLQLLNVMGAPVGHTPPGRATGQHGV